MTWSTCTATPSSRSTPTATPRPRWPGWRKSAVLRRSASWTSTCWMPWTSSWPPAISPVCGAAPGSKHASSSRSSPRARSTRRASRASTTTWGSGSPRGRYHPTPRRRWPPCRARADRRNREMAARVNAYLDPVAIDYERDVLPLTPAGNATERHMLLAYIRAADRAFDGAESQKAAFWAEKLGSSGRSDHGHHRRLCQVLEPGARQADEAGRRRLCPAQPGGLPDRGRVPRHDRRVRRAAVRHMVGRHNRGRTGHRRAARSAGRPGRGRAEYHPRPQLEHRRPRARGSSRLPSCTRSSASPPRATCRSTSAPR